MTPGTDGPDQTLLIGPASCSECECTMCHSVISG